MKHTDDKKDFGLGIKMISVILSFLMIVTVIPSIAVFAEGKDAISSNSAIDIDTKKETEKEPEFVTELSEKRTLNEKYFLMDDGSITVAQYNQPVHFADADGAMKDIDNSLVEVTDTATDKKLYKNKSNSFNVSFSKEIDNGDLAFLEKDEYKIAWSLEQNNITTAKKIESEKTVNKKVDELENIISSIEYDDVFDSTDITYVTNANGVKENIVLKDENAPKQFSFQYNTYGLKYRITDEGNIELYNEEDTETVVFYIEKPYMFDAQKYRSDDVKMEITETENGFEAVITPDEEWINSRERVYPIVIDPTTLSSQIRNQIWDIDMMQGQSHDFSCNAEDLVVGVDSQSRIFRSVIKFLNLPSLGDCSTIVNAKMNVTAYQGPTRSGSPAIRPRPSGNPIVYINRVTQYWPETTNWNTIANSYDPIVTDYFVYSQNDNSFQTDITKLVRGWYEGTYPNYGIMLKSADESTPDKAMQFTSSDYGTNGSNAATWRPVLLINYRNSTGLEDYWSFSTYSAGDFGTTYINNANGNMVYEYVDFEYNSEINSFCLKHIFNSSESGSDMGRYGKGWRLNLVQKLEPVTIESNPAVKYIYTDADGTKHYFLQAEDSNRIIDEDGLGYEYSSINESGLIYKVTAKDGSAMKFDQWGFLREIRDPNNNAVCLNYSPTSIGINVLTSIGTKPADAASQQLVLGLNYDSGYVLESLLHNQIVESYTYQNSSLRHMEKADGIGPYISFTDGISAVDYGNEQRIEYVYDSQKRVSNVVLKDNQNNVKQSTNYAYDYNVTTLTDNLQRKMTYEFDAFSRPVCVFDSNGNTAYCDYSATSSNVSQIFKNNKTILSGNSYAYINNLIENGYLYSGTDGYSLVDYTSGTGTITSVTGEGLVTSSSLKIQINPSGNTGRKLAVAQAPSTSQGKTYTFSAYVKSVNITPDNINPNSHCGALLKVVTNQNEYYSNAIAGTTDTQIDNGYEKISVTFTIGANESLTSVNAGIFDASGEAYIDCLQLEENDTANHINIINNSGFERYSGNNAISFECTGNAGITVSGETFQTGNYCVKIPGNTTADKKVYQTLNQAGNSGDVYTFGAWAKANSVPNVSGHADFRERITFTYTDNTTENFMIDFNHSVSDWQFATKTIKAKKDYSNITVYLDYNKNCGNAYFDSVFLYRDTAQSFEYDSNGNLVATTDASKQNSSFQYSGNNLSSMINPTGTSFTYSYDSKNNLVLARSSSGLQYNISYDANGNPTSSSISSDPYTSQVQPNKEYYIRQKGSGKYLTAQSQTSGGNVSQSTFSGLDTQKWKFEKVDGNCYYIKSVVSVNNVLAVSGGSNDNNSQIVTESNSGVDSQKFTLILENDGSYKFRPKSSNDNKIIVTTSSTGDNVVLHSYTGINDEEQQWYIEEVPTSSVQMSEGIWSFRNRNSGKYFDSRTSNNTLTQYSRGFGDTQMFKLHAVSGNNETLYQIESLSSPGNYLQVITTSTDVYNLAFTQGTTGNGKVFRFYFTDEKCKIADTTYNKYLQVENSSLVEGATVVAVNDGSNATRYWIPEQSSKSIKTSATYSSVGRYVLSSTDSRGKTTSYTYDSYGRPSTVTNPAGATTSYSYVSIVDRLASVSIGNSSVSYGYVNDSTVPNNKALSSITSPSGTVYSFAYDNAERVSSISIGNRTLSASSYNAQNLLSLMTYGNNATVGYNYDSLDRVTQKLYNNTVKFEYKYDKSGNLVLLNDIVNNTTTEYAYDLIGRISSVKSSSGSKIFYKYDQYNRTNLIKYIVGGNSVSLKYLFGETTGQNADLIYGIKQNGTDILSYGYDNLSRLNSRVLNTSTAYTSNYTYLDGADDNSTTAIIKSVTNGNDTLTYSYDDVGNITEIKKNGVVYESYEYDALNQLTKVTRGTDVYTYSYDGGGNITEVKLNGNTVKSYTYGDTSWKDLLTGFNNQTITYDNIGNPLTYRDGFGFEWSNGRQLTGVTHGTDSISYRYDDSGLRTQKTVNSTTTDYYWLNGILQGQKTGNEYIIFLYDENGSAYGFLLKNGTTEAYYYYIFNAQGDVIGIIDESGTQVVEYDYDAWGKLLSVTGTSASTIGQINPIRYRGYYYDNETNIYYLQSRYYDPETGRFINADGQITAGSDILGCNLFAYCGNNPINRADPNGDFSIIAVIGVVAAVVTHIKIASQVLKYANKKSNSKVDKDTKTTTRNKVVNDQNGATGSKFSYGAYPASHNACETIAVHNAKVLTGRSSTLSETITDFQNANAMFGLGFFGSNPYAIGNVLSNEGIEYSRVGLTEMTQPGVYIISFWTGKPCASPLHTVAVDYNGKAYTTYNLNGYGRTSDLDPTLYAYNYICGYYLR